MQLELLACRCYVIFDGLSHFAYFVVSLSVI